MQLNSLTLNSKEGIAQSNPKLAIYDHKVARIHSQIFVFGKKIQNFSIQTPLHKLNTFTLELLPVLTLNVPVFEDFIMFPVNSLLYFLGKTTKSKKIQLYQFDGLKFTKLDQKGHVPEIEGPYANCIFSNEFLLIFGGFKQNECLNKWYMFHIKTRIWKQATCNIQMPICQKSSLIWKNGRGYLLLKQAYLKNKKYIEKNMLYEVKITNFQKLLLKCQQIPLCSQITQGNTIFEHIFTFSDKKLMFIGNEQLEFQMESKQFKTDKKVFLLNLQTLQWSIYPDSIKLKGINHEVINFENRLYAIGGIYKNQLIRQIQIINFPKTHPNECFPYEQSRCYYCEQAFTYKQNFTRQAFIQKQYESFGYKNKIENKFLKKYSQSFISQFQAIGVLCDFMTFLKSKQIRIDLSEQIAQSQQFFKYRDSIQTSKSQILVIRGSIGLTQKNKQLEYCLNNKQIQQQRNVNQELELHINKLRIASFKIGTGFLFVTKLDERNIIVAYSSFSQTDFPQSDVRTYSSLYYTIKLDPEKKTYVISSQINRSIIFQNVRLYFGTSESYQNINRQLYNQTNTKALESEVQIYIIGVNNLQKTFSFSLSKNTYYEDIIMKNVNKKNPSNSLSNYMKHLYLTKKATILLENIELQCVNVYNTFLSFEKGKQIKEISIEDDMHHKQEFQDTHFSQNHDEIVHWRKLDFIQKCKIYEVKKSKSHRISKIYQSIFLYSNKRLVKTFQSKKNLLCGIIQLSQQVEISLNQNNFAYKKDQKKINIWLEQIQNLLQEENSLSSLDI